MNKTNIILEIWWVVASTLSKFFIWMAIGVFTKSMVILIITIPYFIGLDNMKLHVRLFKRTIKKIKKRFIRK